MKNDSNYKYGIFFNKENTNNENCESLNNNQTFIPDSNISKKKPNTNTCSSNVNFDSKNGREREININSERSPVKKENDSQIDYFNNKINKKAKKVDCDIDNSNPNKELSNQDDIKNNVYVPKIYFNNKFSSFEADFKMLNIDEKLNKDKIQNDPSKVKKKLSLLNENNFTHKNKYLTSDNDFITPETSDQEKKNKINTKIIHESEEILNEKEIKNKKIIENKSKIINQFKNQDLDEINKKQDKDSTINYNYYSNNFPSKDIFNQNVLNQSSENQIANPLYTKRSSFYSENSENNITSQNISNDNIDHFPNSKIPLNNLINDTQNNFNPINYYKNIDIKNLMNRAENIPNQEQPYQKHQKNSNNFSKNLNIHSKEKFLENSEKKYSEEEIFSFNQNNLNSYHSNKNNIRFEYSNTQNNSNTNINSRLKNIPNNSQFHDMKMRNNNLETSKNINNIKNFPVNNMSGVNMNFMMGNNSEYGNTQLNQPIINNNFNQNSFIFRNNANLNNSASNAPNVSSNFRSNINLNNLNSNFTNSISSNPPMNNNNMNFNNMNLLNNNNPYNMANNPMAFNNFNNNKLVNEMINLQSNLIRNINYNNNFQNHLSNMNNLNNLLLLANLMNNNNDIYSNKNQNNNILNNLMNFLPLLQQLSLMNNISNTNFQGNNNPINNMNNISNHNNFNNFNENFVNNSIIDNINDLLIRELENILNQADKIDENVFNKIKNNFVTLLKSQNGSRVFQKFLKNTHPLIIKKIFYHIYSILTELLMDPYANYFCQKFFVYLEKDDRLEFLKKVD